VGLLYQVLFKKLIITTTVIATPSRYEEYLSDIHDTSLNLFFTSAEDWDGIIIAIG
jgi:hypothetical protein